MSIRQIHPENSSLPPLRLPPGALAEADAHYEYDVETDPPKVEPIEHRIRIDFIAGAPVERAALLGSYNPWNNGPGDPDPWRTKPYTKPDALRYAEATCQRVWNNEQRVFENYDSDAILDQAPEYLAHQLRQCREQTNPEVCVQEERSNRKSWYLDLILWKNLYEVCKKGNLGGLFPGGSPEKVNRFVGEVVIPDDVDPAEYAEEIGVHVHFVSRESNLNDKTSEETPLPSDLGIDLPAPLLVGDFESGSRYAFLPWSDGLICSCPYKHGYPWRVACKHELLAAIVAGLNDSIVLPVDHGLEVPKRARRLVSPAVYCDHEPQTVPGTI
jgi:hypothetical protein